MQTPIMWQINNRLYTTNYVADEIYQRGTFHCIRLRNDASTSSTWWTKLMSIIGAIIRVRTRYGELVILE